MYAIYFTTNVKFDNFSKFSTLYKQFSTEINKINTLLNKLFIEPSFINCSNNTE